MRPQDMIQSATVNFVDRTHSSQKVLEDGGSTLSQIRMHWCGMDPVVVRIESRIDKAKRSGVENQRIICN